MKQKESLTAFEKVIKIWNSHNCPCRLSKVCCWHRIYLNYDFLGLFNVSSETSYIEGSSHMETSQSICHKKPIDGFLWNADFSMGGVSQQPLKFSNRM